MSFPVSLSIDVAWGEMDAYGHVNNTVFFRYFESTRIAYFRALQELEGKSIELDSVVARATCDYLSSIKFPDTVIGETRVSKIGTSSFTMEYQLTSKAQNKVVAKGEAVIVCVDRSSGKAQPIPNNIRDRITRFEGSNK